MNEIFVQPPVKIKANTKHKATHPIVKSDKPRRARSRLVNWLLNLITGTVKCTFEQNSKGVERKKAGDEMSYSPRAMFEIDKN